MQTNLTVQTSNLDHMINIQGDAQRKWEGGFAKVCLEALTLGYLVTVGTILLSYKAY